VEKHQRRLECSGTGRVDMVHEADKDRALRELYNRQLAVDKKCWDAYQQLLQEGVPA
jgi:hypothetical protein